MKKNISYLILLLSILVACTPQKLATKSNQQFDKILIDTAIAKDHEMNLFLADYKIGMDTLMNQVIGFTKFPLTKAQPECTLGYLIADAQLSVMQQKDSLVKVSVSNQGGIRIPYLAPGEITMGEVFEIMPFDNTLVVVEVPQDVMQVLCDHIAAKGGWPVNGISFQIKDQKAFDIKVMGAPIREHFVYRVVMSDYIANGGDDCDFLRPMKKTSYNILVRDAMIDYIKNENSKGKQLEIELQNRITYAD